MVNIVKTAAQFLISPNPHIKTYKVKSQQETKAHECHFEVRRASHPRPLHEIQNTRKQAAPPPPCPRAEECVHCPQNLSNGGTGAPLGFTQSISPGEFNRAPADLGPASWTSHPRQGPVRAGVRTEQDRGDGTRKETGQNYGGDRARKPQKSSCPRLTLQANGRRGERNTWEAVCKVGSRWPSLVPPQGPCQLCCPCTWLFSFHKTLYCNILPFTSF